MKKQIISIVFIMNIIIAAAQTPHEFSVSAGGGLSTLSYQLSSGDATRGGGGDFGAGYTYSINSNLGIHTGIGAGLYTGKAKLDGVTTVVPNLTDSEGIRFDLYTTLDRYTETQRTMFLNIPVMAKYQAEEKQGVYAMGGVKIGIPLKGKFSSSNATVTNEGYYPGADNWATTQEFAGYGVFDGRKFNGNIDLGVSFMLAFEAGMKWEIGQSLSLYTGAYFDYGLNSVVKGSRLPPVTYTAEHAPDFTTGSALSSLTDRVNMIAAGIVVRLGLIKN
jgi:hypothetical protein